MTVATEPRNTLLMPPSLYKCLNTSKTPLYCVEPFPCPWTWSKTFARSTGAATNVVGMADKKPAAAISDVENVESFLLGVAARIKSFAVS